MQSDPIGLEGGFTTYVYVDSDPHYWSDREGLGRGPKPGTPPAAPRPRRFDDGGLNAPGERYPSGGGLYQFVNTCNGEVLYIGRAANFRARYHNHNKPGDRLDQAEAFCGCGVVMMPYVLEDDPKVRDPRERQGVRNVDPAGNQVFTGRRRRF